MPLTIGICGGTGSGKTTVSNKILGRIGKDRAMIMQQDHYYRDLEHIPRDQRNHCNFDHPQAFDWDLFIENLKRLQSNQSIEQPIYNFHTHSRMPSTERLESKPLIIVEGILVFEKEELRNRMDIRLFVDTDSDIRFIRRLQRDTRERGRSLESVIHQYTDTVRPMHMQFVESSKYHADVIIPGGGENRIAIDMVISRIQSWFRQHNIQEAEIVPTVS
jgi:uridine kinase